MVEIFDLAAATDVHELARSDEHVISGHDVRDWWLARIISSYPQGDRYVVACPTVGDRQETVQTQQQLRSAIIVGCEKCKTVLACDGRQLGVGSTELYTSVFGLIEARRDNAVST